MLYHGNIGICPGMAAGAGMCGIAVRGAGGLRYDYSVGMGMSGAELGNGFRSLEAAHDTEKFHGTFFGGSGFFDDFGTAPDMNAFAQPYVTFVTAELPMSVFIGGVFGRALYAVTALGTIMCQPFITLDTDTVFASQSFGLQSTTVFA